MTQNYLNFSALIVDDDSATVSLLEEIVSQAQEEHNKAHPCKVSITINRAYNGKVGLEKYATLLKEPNQCLFVISDYSMPFMRGDEMVRQIKELNPTQTIVFISGGESGEIIKKLENGCSRFFGKPFHFDEVVTYFKDLIAGACLTQNSASTP